MAKKGFDVSEDLKRFEGHKKAVKRAEVAVAKNAARDALAGVNRAAPEDTGALKESGYVINREWNGTKTSGYERHIVEAALSSDKSGFKGQVEDELPVPADGGPGDGRAWAALHIPVDYADILIEGFHNVRSGTDVAPNDFFNPAVDAVNATYNQRAQRALDEEVKKLG